jgi:hypothetical protein
LSEKQSLNKTLSDTQRELDRLRSQHANDQSILAEKLTLERQLNSLEVQIQNERRAFERTRANDTKTEDGAMAKMQIQLTTVQRELATLISERQQLKKDSQDTAAQWEDEKKAMKEKLEMLQKKLKVTKERLRESRNEGRQNTSVVMDEGETDVDPPKQGVSFTRTTTAFNPDMTIATPGGVRFAGQAKRASTAPGEKSSFSITPYLSRTNNLPDSPGSSSQAQDEDLGDIAAGTHDGGELELVPETRIEKSTERLVKLVKSCAHIPQYLKAD